MSSVFCRNEDITTENKFNTELLIMSSVFCRNEDITT